jgi:hypothetical protein
VPKQIANNKTDRARFTKANNTRNRPGEQAQSGRWCCCQKTNSNSSLA